MVAVAGGSCCNTPEAFCSSLEHCSKYHPKVYLLLTAKAMAANTLMLLAGFAPPRKQLVRAQASYLKIAFTNIGFLYKDCRYEGG